MTAGISTTNTNKRPRDLLQHADDDQLVLPEIQREFVWTRKAVMLDFIRRRGKTSELSPKETVRRLVNLFRHAPRFKRLLKVSTTEPPRVRAILGAIGEELGTSDRALKGLRDSLNPLSRYDFGVLTALPAANRWQAKKERRR